MYTVTVEWVFPDGRRERVSHGARARKYACMFLIKKYFTGPEDSEVRKHLLTFASFGSTLSNMTLLPGDTLRYSFPPVSHHGGTVAGVFCERTA